MKIFNALSIVAALGASVLAQDLSSLPSCAQTCAFTAVSGSSCSYTDVDCICSTSTFVSSFSSCVKSSCSESDQATATELGTQLCSSAGVSVNPSATSGIETKSATASASSSSPTKSSSGNSLHISFSNSTAATTSGSMSSVGAASSSTAPSTAGAANYQASRSVMAGGLAIFGFFGLV